MKTKCNVIFSWESINYLGFFRSGDYSPHLFIYSIFNINIQYLYPYGFRNIYFVFWITNLILQIITTEM